MAVIEHADFACFKSIRFEHAVHDMEIMFTLDWVGKRGIDFDHTVNAAKEVP